MSIIFLAFFTLSCTLPGLMADTSTRSDLIRLSILMAIIIGMVVGLKVLDQKTGIVGNFGSKIYVKIFSTQ